MEIRVNQKITREELTTLLCTEEIASGLLTEDKPLMQPSIVEGRFYEYTNSRFIIKWDDDNCRVGVVKPAPRFTKKDQEFLNSLATVDTSEYEEE